MGGIENADYETLIDCARWATDNDYLPYTLMPGMAAAKEIVRFIAGDPKDDAEAREFREIFDQWQEETR